MNRIQMACYALLASAFVLAGLLFSMVQDRLPAAKADPMVVARDNFSLMTARTSAQEESLFLLDNQNQRIIVYRVDLARGRFVVGPPFDVGRAFGNR